MAEIFVSPLVSLLIENLAPLGLSFIPSGGIDPKLMQWTQMLLTIQAVLEDAEDRQLNEKPIQLWLHDVQKLAFEVDDVVDDLVTEARRRQIIATPESSSSGRLRKFTSKFSPAAIKFNYDMDRKIGEISNGLQELEKRKNFLSLQRYDGGRYERAGDLRLPLTSSVVDPARVFGREEDCAAILRWLLKDIASDHDGQLRVISIVGMGGIGKSTLAQFLYNDEGVKKLFRDRAWVCVTEDFDVRKISKIIYEEVYEQSCAFNELNKVQEKLREKLSNKKFLVVLDDVWNENYAKWDLLSAPLLVGAPGSTIIVTTRSQDVANTMGSKEVYDLKVLSDGDCLSLLAQHAFGKLNFDGHPEFKEVGEVIAKRCKGLPLAAKSLGGLLRTKRSPNQWIEVSTSKIWELRRNDIIPALRLSYHHLPPYLKPLFVYCSLFPKGYEFDKHGLIMLWMAQGFLRQSGEPKQMEELGWDYFGELLSRFFFQRSTGNKSMYMMHDLNNDLAQFVAGLTYLRLDDKMVCDEQYKVSEESRHASFISHEYDDFKKFKAINEARCLRTLLPIREKSLESYYIRDMFFGGFYLSSLVLKDFPKLPCLRALSFKMYNISELPKSIGYLNHLRYLDLSWTNIKELPKSVCALSNLQTLLLHGCHELVRLRKSIKRLINLRHLDIFDTPSLKEMPLGIGLLTHLRTLSKFIVDKSDGRKITELKGLHHLQGTLSMIGMENVMSIQNAMEANLWGKEGLHGLGMEWSYRHGDSELEYEVLDAVKPHIRLASLSIDCYGGKKFPSWVGDRLFGDMVKVRLFECNYCVNLPPLGQLTSLKELFIQGMDGVKIVGPEFYGTPSPDIVAFRSIIKLSFMNMGSWEEWNADSTRGAFPCLQHLEIRECMNLNKVSIETIPSLESLVISSCSERVFRSMAGVGSVKKLELFNIAGLSKLDEGIIGCLGEVEDLSVSHCYQLRYLWEEEVACQALEKLKSLTVHYCEQLESLGDEEQLPHNLESLELVNCDKLENQGESSTRRHGDYEFSNLEKVRIGGCPSLKRFPTGKKLPTTLRDLTVINCENMEELADEGMSLSLLESVRFSYWSKLKSLPQGLAHLTRLDITGCLGIESIPETSLPPTLIELDIRNCSNLKYMLCANEMRSLTSLRQLRIIGCENLESYPSGAVSWPPSLELLIMGDVKQPIKEWGLATLSISLLKLGLFGDFPQVVTFSEVGTQLPSSLTHLHIKRFKNLKSLREGLENLSSLQRLRVSDCPKLHKLPEMLLPTLSSLQITECPVLKERCKKWNYWPKISHIPCIKIDGYIFWGL